ncbi:MAG: hypothetical protein RR643_04965 [Anaerorhabdus sp.]|uniref:hypothetical protein n=1 Tax=Anaerorhabdus sp. TaxID=1872524 RepID=UPI002FC9DBCB
MTVEGITFDLMRVTPMDDALIYDAMMGNKNRVLQYSENLALTTTGLNVYIAKGAAVVEGRLIRISDQEAIPVAANGTGYICLVIDLTKVNSFVGTPGSSNYVPINNQVRVEALKTLVQQDLHSTGKLYTYPLASYVSTAGAITLTPLNTSGELSRGFNAITCPDTAGVSGTKALGAYVTGTSSQFVQQSSWVVCKEAGFYKFQVVASLSGASSGTRNLALTVNRNGSAVAPVYTCKTQANSNGSMQAIGLIELKVGDQLSMESSGSAAGTMQQIGGFVEQV